VQHHILTALLAILVATIGNQAHAQPCTPNADCSDGDFIDNFIFNSISNLSSGGSNCTGNSYINTGQSTSITISNKYELQVLAGSAWPQGFGVWIDYNQDDDFDDTDEFIYASPTAGNSVYSDSILISSIAIPGTTVLRVRSQYNQTINAGESCTTFTWGETEDYSVTIIASSSPPVVDFTADTIVTCNGTINFTDLSLNSPTSWIWDFGDGFTSTSQNPTHFYDTTGTFSVSLKATNGFGNDSLNKVNYISVTVGGPIAPSCAPGTAGNCCQMGIHNVTFNTINNSTNDGADGYQDYSCSISTTVTINQSYAIAIETGPSFTENVKVWIDYDNDGVFTGSELVFESLNITANHSGTVVIPGSATVGTALRMRVGSDWSAVAVPSPCTDAQYGQFEDYAVLAEPDTMPPVANFSSDVTFTCSGVVNFTDISTGSPVTWFWDFGDGNTDTVQNPSHTYTFDSSFTVTLIVTNAFGSDTLTVSNYINKAGAGPVTASCTPATLNYCCGFGITNVTFNTINLTTADASAGYEDHTCDATTNVIEGQSYTMSIDVSGAAPGKQNVRAWIDYNNDGTLNNVTELIFSADNQLTASGTVTISPGAVLNTPLRLRIASDYDFEAVPTPCADLERGQAEDYTVIIQPNTNPAIADFMVDNTVSCTGVVSFTDLSDNVPTFWWWDFGDGNTSNLQHPTHSYTVDSVYTVTLYAANSNGGDTIVYAGLITVNLSAGPVPASCTPSTLGYCCGYGIYTVTFKEISNSTGSGNEGYSDYSCTEQAFLTEGQSYTISMTTGVSNPQDTRVWIDYNNDGVFNDGSERVFTGDDMYNPSGVITIPTGGIRDTALRMRITSDYSGSAPLPCTDSWYGQTEDYAVIIGIPPTANFSSSDSSFCEGICIDFTDLSTDSATTWSWSFPGASPSASNVQHPTNICYPNSGNFNVILTASNVYGNDSKAVSSMITVLSCPTPVVAFSVSKNNICIGECISFTDQTANNPDTWSWSFPGANTTASTDENPSNICYSTVGTYEVTLVASNINGTDSLTTTGFINVGTCNPIAGFSSTDTSFCETLCIGFNDLTTNNPTAWFWSFPGASPNTSNDQNPTDICYNTPGTYDVTLIASNPSDTDTITLTAFLDVQVCPKPTSNFAASDTVICPGTCINFTDSSLNANSYQWTFNGATPLNSTNKNPTNICYNSPPGTYDVMLVTGNNAGFDTLIKTIKIENIVAATSVNDTVYKAVPTTFTDISTGNPNAWTWDFGDGNFTNFQNPVYAYSANGQYTLTLIIVNAFGCTDTMTMMITVVDFIGINDMVGENRLLVFPNPTTDRFTIHYKSANKEKINVSVEDILGRTVFYESSKPTSNYSANIDLSSNSPGIYFIEITNGKDQFIRKIVRY